MTANAVTYQACVYVGGRARVCGRESRQGAGWSSKHQTELLNLLFEEHEQTMRKFSFP